MQNTLLLLFTFVFILFLYIHITSQWKTSNDLEIYESDFESPTQLQEVCSVKQPVIIKFPKIDSPVHPFFDRFQAPLFEKYDNLDIKIKDVNDYNRPTDKNNSVDYVPVSFRSARRLLMTDTTGKYFSENNHEFLEESGLDRLFGIVDGILKPPLTAVVKHDILLGSPHIKTPLRYRINSHTFLVCTKGKIRVKMCPPKYGKILPLLSDYETYEFRSTVNPWSPDRETMSRIKFLDFEVVAGDILYIPMYWWYSISFSGDPDTTVAGLYYDVVMNILAQSKHWTLYYLQQSNIKTKPAKTIIASIDGAKEEDPVAADKQLDATENPIKEETPKKREIITNAGTYVVNNDNLD